MMERRQLLDQDMERFRRNDEGIGEMVLAQERAKRIRQINRDQTRLHMIDVDKLVDADHAVRGIWEMVSRLDMGPLEKSIKAVEGGAGQSSLDPRLLTSLWIYATSLGVSSGRELSRMCEYEPGCQWLTAMEVVNHHTLSDFRVKDKAALDAMFVQVLGLLSSEGLVELTRVMQDGTKIKAQASGSSFRREVRIREHLQLAREQVEAMDSPESDQTAQQVSRARRRAAEEKRERLEQAVKELEQLQEKRPEAQKADVRVSETDPDARIMKQADGGFAPSYNVQISTEASHGIIVAVAATQAGNDYGELQAGIDRVQANTGRQPDQMVVDGGFIRNSNIEAADDRGIDLIGPMSNSNREATFRQRGIAEDFYPDKFEYDAETDTFRCPAGKTLTLKQTLAAEGRIDYLYRAQARDCESCSLRNQCCPKVPARSVVRKEDSEKVKAFRAKMETEEAKAIYRTRSQIAEFPNAWIKDKLRLRQFRVRGLRKVGMQALWACLTYNVQQWMRLSWKLGVQAV